MPTVLRVDGYRFFFYSLDHLPAHVHVERADAVAKFEIDPVRLVSNSGFRSHDLTRLRLLVIQHRELFLEKWHEFFGNQV